MRKYLKKIRLRVWNKIVSQSLNKTYYPYLYKSYWHYLFTKNISLNTNTIQYFTAFPNQGAGIGHQMANWIAGYWWAKQFGMVFAHIPFSNPNWEKLLGFGEDEVKVQELLKNGYKKIGLPLFTEGNKIELERIQKIINSYYGKNVVFVCETDQSYMDQYGVMDSIQYKFNSANARNNDILLYSNSYFNIAIHVRRGDIVIGQKNQNPNLLLRWQDNNYFINVLDNVLKLVKTDKPILIYLFSQGLESNFEDFKKYPNLQFCLDMNPMDSFIHMVKADLLITSKSSFSYKPALLSKGIKVCPKNFWHGYPETKDWILADDEGNINIKY